MASFYHWLQATRLRTIPLSIASILCGSLIAKIAGDFNIIILILSVVTAVSIQIFSNLSNDYGDAIHGADSELRQGPKRMVAAGYISLNHMKLALIISAFICCLCGIILLVIALPNINASKPNIWLIWLCLGTASITAAFCYTAGSKPYGYAGLGDIFVFLFFGWLGVLGSAYLQMGAFHLFNFIPASAMGLWCCMVLNINNIRDIKTDLMANKKTIAARLGAKKAKYYHISLLIIAAILWCIWLIKILKHPLYIYLIIILFILSLIHLYTFINAKQSSQFNQLLANWSMNILIWIFILWCAI